MDIFDEDIVFERVLYIGMMNSGFPRLNCLYDIGMSGLFPKWLSLSKLAEKAKGLIVPSE